MEEKGPSYALHHNVGDLHVSDIYNLYDFEPSVVHMDDPVSKMVAALITRPRGRNVYVTGAEGNLIGIISFRDILRVTNARLGARRSGVMGFVQYMSDIFREDVEGLMREPVWVKPDDNLLEALKKMEEFKMNDMPVVDDENVLVGELSGMEILRFAYADIKKGDEEAPKVIEEERDKRRIQLDE